jgi:hypothetical protein
MDTNLKKVKIFDTNFSHVKYSTLHQTSEFIEWYRDENLNTDDITFFTDNFINLNVGVKEKKIGWLLEPPSINPKIYENVITLNDNFNKVLTYSKDLLDRNGNFEFYPHGGCWIPKESQKIYEKNKMVSIIASNKDFTYGHRLRHDIINKFNNKINTYGRGYNPIDEKTEGLKDYKFSIVVENIKMDYYFTEKIIDCFMTGTIPIYYGCPSINKFFDINGIIVFNTIEELENILYNLSEKDYNQKYESVKNNFARAKEFLISEDWIYKNTKIFK